jgi:hypothetical protein
MKVHIIDFEERKNKDGELFYTLTLEGDVEMVRSQASGRYYATAKRASVTSTFDEERCKQLKGSTMPGTIVKSECEPYEYTIPETGEVVMLNHTYEYQPVTDTQEDIENAVFERQNGLSTPQPA